MDVMLIAVEGDAKEKQVITSKIIIATRKRKTYLAKEFVFTQP